MCSAFVTASDPTPLSATNYTENYEYTGSVSNDEGTQTPEHTGKIDKATAAQITNKTFYIDTLKWDEKIWYLDDVAGGKRPRLKAEGDVYGAEEEDTSKGEGSEGDSNNASSQEVVYIQAPVQDEETEEPQMAGETPAEVISFIAQKNAEEIAAMDSLESVKDYQADRKLIYENLRLFMPFYTYEQIVKDGNKVDPSHVLNKKTVLAVYPMDDRGNRIVALSDKTVQEFEFPHHLKRFLYTRSSLYSSLKHFPPYCFLKRIFLRTKGNIVLCFCNRF